MLFTRSPFLASPHGGTNCFLNPTRTLLFKEFPYLTSAELSKRYHHRLLFLTWLKLPTLPQMHCSNCDTSKNGQFFLGDAHMPAKASDQAGRES